MEIHKLPNSALVASVNIFVCGEMRTRSKRRKSQSFLGDLLLLKRAEVEANSCEWLLMESTFLLPSFHEHLTLLFVIFNIFSPKRRALLNQTR